MPLPVRVGSLVLSGMMVAGLLVMGLLAGCSPFVMVVGAGTTVGLASAQERGLSGTLSDTRIRADINEKWLQNSMEMLQKLELAVVEGRVLLTGVVPTPEMRLDAIRLTWQVLGVREVINEIQVGSVTGGAMSYARDNLIITQLRSEIMFDRGIQAINYSLETIDGVVYLMGVAQSQAELDRVIDRARNLRYVKRVVSHVRLKDQPLPPVPAPRPAG